MEKNNLLKTFKIKFNLIDGLISSYKFRVCLLNLE